MKNGNHYCEGSIIVPRPEFSECNYRKQVREQLYQQECPGVQLAVRNKGINYFTIHKPCIQHSLRIGVHSVYADAGHTALDRRTRCRSDLLLLLAAEAFTCNAYVYEQMFAHTLQLAFTGGDFALPSTDQGSAL
ncbi:hypothetical protein N7G274_003958 [Stereocaulon virgatum]|uniref:Uncharacterized protein n=1 Tax=Stereocaulon virgatum TaxID=373712 RepID=A0ABR4AFR4_9LECA